MSEKDAAKADKFWIKFEAKIEAARAFHAKLGSQCHPNTHLVYSTGLATVVNARFELKQQKGEKYLYLRFPYETSQSGDGTVPETSQHALLAHGAKLAGSAVTKGNVVHADICNNPTAIKQVLDVSAVLTESLRPAAAQKAKSS